MAADFLLWIRILRKRIHCLFESGTLSISIAEGLPVFLSIQSAQLQHFSRSCHSFKPRWQFGFRPLEVDEVVRVFQVIPGLKQETRSPTARRIRPGGRQISGSLVSRLTLSRHFTSNRSLIPGTFTAKTMMTAPEHVCGVPDCPTPDTVS